MLLVLREAEGGDLFLVVLFCFLCRVSTGRDGVGAVRFAPDGVVPLSSRIVDALVRV